MNEHLRKAAEWLRTLPIPQQQNAAAYYGVPYFAMRAFEMDFGLKRVHDEGGWFLPYADLENDLFRRISSHLGKPGFDFMLAEISVPSLRFAGLSHGVGLKIDGKTSVIHHQDPQGDPIRSSLKETLNGIFPRHKIVDLQIRQQRDMYSCALITSCNMLAFARGEELDPDIDEKLIGIRAFHAPGFLDTWHEMASRNALKKTSDTERQGEYSGGTWKSVAETVTKRDTGLLLPEAGGLSDMFEFLFRLAPDHCVPAGK
jgi:hypothetical protein